MTKQARLVGEVLGIDVEPFARGGESRTYRLSGSDLLVSVPLAWPDERVPGEELTRTAMLLGRIEERVGVPVPHVERVMAEEGLLVVRLLAGERLIEASAARHRDVRHHMAEVLGSLLGELHTWERAAYDELADVDDYAPEDWLRETATTAAGLEPLLSAAQQRDVHRFLSEPAPEPAANLVLSHNDLGIEHVLVSTESGATRVTGVIDWDDAAIVDPAHDFGLLLRDLGPDALNTALEAYVAAGGIAQGIPARALFYARCKLLEDLAFGYADGRTEYVEKGIAAWEWAFRANPVH